MWFFLIVFTLLLVILDRFKYKKLNTVHKKLGCDFLYIPIFGHIFVLIGKERRIQNYLQMARQNYNSKHGMSSFWVVNQLFIVINDPLQAKAALKALLNKGTIGKLSGEALGNSSVFRPGKEWHPRRKVMGAILAPRFVNKFNEVMIRHSEDICDKLLCEVSKGDFCIWQYLYSYSLDVITESTIGTNIRTKDHYNQQFINALEKSMDNLAYRICHPWQHMDFAHKLTQNYRNQLKCKEILTSFVKELVNQKKISMEQSQNDAMQNDQPDFKQTLLELMIQFSENDEEFTDEVILEEVLLLLEATAHPSTTNAGFICVLLSLYEDVQEKAYKEIEEFFANENAKLNLTDMKEFPYIEAVIKESLRLYPPGPQIIRACDKDLEMPSGIVLGSGSTLLINILGIHRNPLYWGSDSEEFRPERFLEGAPSHPAAFLPFGFGPRNCPGQRYAMMMLKSLFIHILQRYRIKPATCFQNDRNLKLYADIMLKPKNHFTVQLEPRN